MTNGQINSTELVAALICKKDSFVEGIRYVQSVVEGSMTLLLLTENGIYAARDLLGRTPVVIGKKENAYCCLLYTSPSPRDVEEARMPSSA